MVDVKQATEKATAYAGDLLGVNDILLEAVRSDDHSFKITLSFPDRRMKLAVNPIVKWAGHRETKVFDVDKKTGEVLEMRDQL